MKNLLFLALIVISSIVVTNASAAEPANRPEFVRQLVVSNGNQGAAAMAWGVTDKGNTWFIYLDDKGYVKFFLDSPAPTLKSSKKFDVYPRGEQTVIVGDTAINSSLGSEEKISVYLKALKKLGVPTLEIREIFKS